MKVLVDTGPLLAGVDRHDAAHGMAAPIVARLRHDAVIPTPVLVEVDHLTRSRVGHGPARQFSRAVAGGLHEVAYLSPGLLRRAIELDSQYADLNLGFVDTCVMAIAERHELPILTFDFTDFRATESKSGPWELVVDEHAYRRVVAQ